MNMLNDFLLFLDSLLGSAAWFPFILLGVGAFFTIYLGFPQIRFFKHAWKVVAGKYDHKHKNADGDTSHFQALSTALCGTLGVGNIGGVALALSIGGPAALFWMWATAFMGMTTKFVEVTLSHKYRVKTSDGTMAGGPMYYMDRGLNMKWLAVIFAVATVVCSFGTGNMPQINNIAQGMQATFGLSPWITGGVLTIILALVIIGGIRRIAAVASSVVPFMSVFYVLACLAVVVYNIDNVIPSFISIFSSVFTGSAATGGFLGASIAYAFNRGVARGLFSNEAGQGSAPIAHASAKSEEPVSEGMVSILEPFLDTIIICTITALAILSSGAWYQKHENQFQRSDMFIVQGIYQDSEPQQVEQLFKYLNGKNDHQVEMFTGAIKVEQGQSTSDGYTIINARSIAEDVTFWVGRELYSGEVKVQNGKLVNQSIIVKGKSLVHSTQLTTIAFGISYFGDFGQYIVAFSVLLFAFTTAIAWSYYGDRAMIFLFGMRSVMPYRVFYVAGFFWAAVADTTLVWNLAAVAIVVMTLPNLLGLMLMRKEMKQLVKDYWQRHKNT